MAAGSKRILVIHGPNLNLLGNREVQVYGSMGLEKINSLLLQEAGKFGVELDCIQSNDTGELLERICLARGKYRGIIINPGALTHYGLALGDALAGLETPVVEVHLSNVYNREGFRSRSVSVPFVFGQISGFGYRGYLLALWALCEINAREGNI